MSAHAHAAPLIIEQATLLVLEDCVGRDTRALRQDDGCELLSKKIAEPQELRLEPVANQMAMNEQPHEREDGPASPTNAHRP